MGGLHHAPGARVGSAHNHDYSCDDSKRATKHIAYRYASEPFAALECDGTRAEGGCWVL